jgi:ABC-2 type transport system ATP-binding protein
VLRLRGVEKRYGATHVLRGVDLDVDDGEIIGVLGANGSGKSTLLRIIAGVSTWDSGEVDGRPRVGFLPDRFPADQRMAAIDYLRHMARIRGLPRAIAKRDATELLDRLGLEPHHDAPMRLLSKGNAQKVGLAQALISQPDLLVLDEPWSGLDPDTQRTLSEIIAEERETGTSVVFTDHREAVVAAHATRTYHLVDGLLKPIEANLTPQTSRVVLARDNGRAQDLPWTNYPGVVVERRDSGSIELTVPDLYRDELLLLALRGHWSIREVVPS